MSPNVNEEQEAARFQSDEEEWFCDRDRKRPRSRSSPPPPPPIGDELADGWFR